jgi:hypothetical protein
MLFDAVASQSLLGAALAARGLQWLEWTNEQADRVTIACARVAQIPFRVLITVDAIIMDQWSPAPNLAQG